MAWVEEIKTKFAKGNELPPRYRVIGNHFRVQLDEADRKNVLRTDGMKQFFLGIVPLLRRQFMGYCVQDAQMFVELANVVKKQSTNAMALFDWTLWNEDAQPRPGYEYDDDKAEKILMVYAKVALWVRGAPEDSTLKGFLTADELFEYEGCAHMYINTDDGATPRLYIGGKQIKDIPEFDLPDISVVKTPPAQEEAHRAAKRKSPEPEHDGSARKKLNFKVPALPSRSVTPEAPQPRRRRNAVDRR